MIPALNEIVLSLALLGVGMYFTLQSARLVLRLLRFRRLNTRELLTWPPRRLPYLNLYRGLGLASAVLAMHSAMTPGRRYLVISQVVMALYFLGLLPLAARVRPGFYQSGVWTESGFIGYRRVGRWAFVDQPEIVLLLLPRGKRLALRLKVPSSEYGAARKLIHANVGESEGRILNL